MRYLALFAGLLALACAHPSNSLSGKEYHRCADPEPSDEFKRKSAEIMTTFSVAAAAPINVRTFAHVVTTKFSKGAYPAAQIKKQIAVMNKAYKATGVTFSLASTDFTVNDAWAGASPGTQDEADMKFKLHKGTYADLNIYFLSDLNNNEGLLGFCPFPYSDIDAGNSTYTPYIKYDGCLILADSLPGGSAAPYDMGITAVHEVGHWFGTYHVFQGNSCSGDGDYVNDTPFQLTYTSGCPATKDTCPGKGVDSIHNYMDYSDDNCLTEFTKGQQARIKAVYSMFRACDGFC